MSLSSSLPLLAITNLPCSAVSLRQLSYLSVFVAVVVQPPAETHIYTGRRLPVIAFEQMIVNEANGKLHVCTLRPVHATHVHGPCSRPVNTGREHERLK